MLRVVEVQNNSNGLVPSGADYWDMWATDDSASFQHHAALTCVSPPVPTTGITKSASAVLQNKVTCRCEELLRGSKTLMSLPATEWKQTWFHFVHSCHLSAPPEVHITQRDSLVVSSFSSRSHVASKQSTPRCQSSTMKPASALGSVLQTN